jgi:hypothetical protein
MKKALLFASLALTMIATLSLLGCTSSTNTATTTTTTTVPTVKIAKFHINNISGYSSSVAEEVKLTRISDASSTYSLCSIAIGVSATVEVVIPANDNYMVDIYCSSGYGQKVGWNSVSLTAGQTYSVILRLWPLSSSLEGVANDTGAWQ